MNPNGLLTIFVYKQKSPLREFCDNYVRNRIADLSYDKAIEVA